MPKEGSTEAIPKEGTGDVPPKKLPKMDGSILHRSGREEEHRRGIVVHSDVHRQAGQTFPA
jgi:hypothetical protein